MLQEIGETMKNRKLWNSLIVFTLLLSLVLVVPVMADNGIQNGISSAMDMALALAENPAWVTSSSFVASPDPGASGVFSSPLTFFPTGSDANYAVMSTGYIADIPFPGTFANGVFFAGNVRGDTDFDVTIWEIGLQAPEGVDCLSFNFQFLSEEFPEFVGSSYNDAFIAELNESTWTTDDSDIIAPNNFAFDRLGNVISINSVVGLSAANSAGTAFDMTGDNPEDGGATGLLTAFSPITPGSHTLYLSIFDQADQFYDSAVFLDNLRLFDSEGTCQEGVTYFHFIYLPLLER
jgi:hypothetical protein